MRKTLLILSLYLPVVAFTQTWTDQNSSINNDLDDVYFIDDNNGWAVGRQGKIVHTTNGGAAWAEQNSGTTKDLNKVYMISSSVGYAVGDGGTVIKYNGTSWSALNISFSQDMYGVYFLDASTGWVSGDWGCIKMTTNGGTSWSTQMDNSIYSNTFNDLHMLSASEGWAVGSSGRVLKYNGTTWTNVSNPATSNLTELYAVSFTSSNDGFMTGESSSVYHWDGSSWNTFNTALSNNSFRVYDVHMITASLGYAATTPGIGGNGVILKYNGSVWTKDYEYTGMNSELFSGITSTPNGNVFAVAATGLIKVKSGGNPATGILNQQKQLGLDVYPNPFSSTLVIAVTSEQTGSVNVVIKDVQGRILKAMTDQQVTAGHTSITLDGTDLESGIYFYTLTAGKTSVSGKVIRN